MLSVHTWPVRSMANACVTDTAQADLKCGAVIDEPGDVAGNLRGRLADRIVKVLHHRRLDRHETGDPASRNPAVTSRARHRRVHPGDNGACGQGGGLRHVDRNPQAAGAVRIWRGNLDHRHIERNLPVAEQLRDIGKRQRQVVHPTRLTESADVAPYVEDPVPVPRARRIAGADTIGEEMDQDHPGSAQPFQRLDQASGSGTRAAEEDLVAGADNGHRLFGRHHTVMPVRCRLASHAACHTEHVTQSGKCRRNRVHDAAITLSKDADLLVHDSQHTAAELPRLGFLGHSAVEYAVALAQRANARQLALFHHDPWRADAEIDDLVAQHAAAPVRVFAARDGMVVDLP